MKPDKLLAAATLLLLMPARLLAAAGDLDSTFGTAGRVTVPLPNGAVAAAAAVQNDGKIVVVGTTNWYGGGSNFDVIAVRLNANGTLDSTFDGDGIAVLDYGSDISSAAAVCITAAGKILIAGDTAGSPSFDYQTALIRLNADGSRDTTFGGTGRRLYPSAEQMIVSKIRPQADGKFVIGGNTPNFQGTGSFKFFRVDAEGTVDMNFGNGGRSIVDFNQAGDELVDLLVLPDGRIIGVGNSQLGTERSISVMRLLGSGQLDTSVGNGMLSFSIGYRDIARSIHRQFDGKLLIAGETPSGGFKPLGMIVRLNADGTPDQGFGSGGRIVRADSILALNADETGRIFFVGEQVEAHNVYDESLISNAYVQALDADGFANADFAPSGRALVDFGHDDVRSLVTPFALVRLVDGRQLVLGTNNRAELVVARLVGPGGSFGGLISVAQSRSDFSVPYVVSEAFPSAQFLVRRSGGASGAVSVDYAAVSSTAVAGVDFQPTAGTLSWGDGETGVKLITLPLLNDNDYETANETVEIQLSSPSGGAVIGTARAGVAVSSDEGTALVSVTGSTAFESASSVEFVLSRTGDARLRVTVSYDIHAPSGIGATPGVDFTPSTGTITWESNETDERVIHVPLFEDSIAESDEGIEMSIVSNTPGVQGTGGGSTATIVDNDRSTGYFAFFDRNLTHIAESAGATLTLRVWRTDNGTGAVTYDVVPQPFAPGMYAATEGTDYTLLTTQVSWPAGVTGSRDIIIQIANDQVSEGTEAFLIDLRSGGSNYASTQVRILDGAAAPAPTSLVAFSQNQFTVIEGDQDAVVSVVRSGDISFPVSVEVMVTGGSATLGDDYSQASNRVTLEWAAGDGAPKTMTLQIHEDGIPEVDEDIEMFLVNPLGGTGIGLPPLARVVIGDDDTPVGPPGPTIGFAQDSISISEDAPYVDLPVVRTALGGPAFVGFGVRSGSTADNGTEFVVEREPEYLQIYDQEPLDWVRNIRIFLNGDSRFEGDESFVVDLVGVPGYMPVGRRSITVTLVSNDNTIPPPPMNVGFVGTEVSQAENNSPVTLTVSRTGPTALALAVHYETVAGTATSGSDFVAAVGDLQWAAGDAADKTIVVMLSNDTLVEPTENFTVVLSAPTNGAVLTSSTATVSISSEDVEPPPPPSGGGGGGNGGAGGNGGGGGGQLDHGLLAMLATLLAFAALRRTLGIHRPLTPPDSCRHASRGTAAYRQHAPAPPARPCRPIAPGRC